MKELLITNNDNTTSKTYAVYYTSKERYYVIYTEKKKDENGYVILNIAKVLKEVNSTPDGGVIPTGRFIGLEITEQNEWDNAKADIGMIVANLQDSESPVTVNYLPVENINGICIKSSKTFVLREDVFKAIVKEEDAEQIVDTYEPQVELPIVDEPVVPAPVIPEPVVPVAEEPIVPAPIASEPVASVTLEETNESDFDSFNDELTAAPTIAPNPFDFQPLPTVDVEPVEVPEPTPVVNPYVELQKQRDEEMIRNLATDDMQDIVPSPVLTVDSLESNEEPEPVPSFEPQIVNAPVEESFVDSIVADVSNLVDNNVEVPVDTQTSEDDSDYKQLYHDELEKTIELEKELKELHSKLNNIKNIVE